MYFTRALSSAFTAADLTSFQAAYHSSSNNLVQHTQEVAFQLALAPPADGSVRLIVGGSSASSLQKWYQWHGWLLFAGWGVLIPFGTLFARRLPDIGPLWVHIHRLANVLGLAAATAGLIIAVTQFNEGANSTEYSVHKIGGVLVIVLGWLQALGGMARPKAPAPGEKATTLRTVFLWCHRALGYFSIVLAELVIFLGLVLYDRTNPFNLRTYQAVFAGWLAFLLFVAALLELRACFCRPQKVKTQAVSDAKQADAPDVPSRHSSGGAYL